MSSHTEMPSSPCKVSDIIQRTATHRPKGRRGLLSLHRQVPRVKAREERNSRYAEGKLAAEISLDKMAELLGEVTGENVTALFEKFGVKEK